jgi:hypothetical protein
MRSYGGYTVEKLMEEYFCQTMTMLEELKIESDMVKQSMPKGRHGRS